ncbi:MAG TPA: hypothetical protein EYP65_09015, partial [Armatimonadetes bacterium]|nr:hypothetical protein [Armatimonadota bacterium]
MLALPHLLAVMLDPSPFGVVCPWPGLKGVGIRWVRCGAGATQFANWPEIEREPGKFDWSRSDAELRTYYDPEGLSLLPILGYTPKWASKNPSAKKPQHWPPADIRLYGRFVKAIVSRYKGRVKCWEVWNEPNIGFFNGSVKAYTDMLKTAYVSAKSADPDCLIVFGGTAGVDINFIRRAYEFGAGGYFDIMAVHPYQWGPRFDALWFERKLQGLRKLMDEWGDSHKEIWLTEVGWSTADKRITPEIQANLLVQCLTTALTLRHLGVSKVFWFCVKDWGGPGFGIFDTEGRPKPALFAYKTLISLLSGAKYAGRIETGRKEVWAHAFVKGGKSVLVLWHERPEGKEEVLLPCSSSEAAVVDIFGRRKDVKPKGGVLRLVAVHSPTFIEAEGAQAFGRPLPPPRREHRPQPEESWLKGVWLSVSVPESTMRPFVTLGRACELTIEVHNDLPESVKGTVKAEIKALGLKEKFPFSLGP